MTFNFGNRLSLDTPSIKRQVFIAIGKFWVVKKEVFCVRDRMKMVKQKVWEIALSSLNSLRINGVNCNEQM